MSKTEYHDAISSVEEIIEDARNGRMIILVDHDVFRVVPEEERGNALIYDTRGIWNDTGRPLRRAALRIAS